MAFCPQCGSAVNEGAKFCPSCGGRIAQPEIPAQQPAAQPQYQAPAQPQYQAPAAPVPPVQYQAPPQYQTPPQYEPAPQPPKGPTVFGIYGRALGVLFQRPIRLWGMSLLYSLMTVLAGLLAPVLIVSIPITFALHMGMEAIYMAGLKGEVPSSPQLFKGFEKGNFLRFVGGLAWMYLWVIIWSLIPIVGIVFGIIKAYSYRFVPYILLTDPNANAFDALKRSMEMTKGYRGKMFWADVLIYVAIGLISLILGLLGAIPFVGVLFIIIAVIFSIAVAALLPLLQGLIRVSFFDEISNK